MFNFNEIQNKDKNAVRVEDSVMVNNNFIRNPNLTLEEKYMYLILSRYCEVGEFTCSPSLAEINKLFKDFNVKETVNVLESLEKKSIIEIVKGEDKNTYILK